MDTTQFGILFEKEMMRYLGMSLIVSCPVLILLSQVALAIREIAINTRKEDHPFSDTQYKSLYWIAYLIFAFGWGSLGLGVIAVLKTL